MKKPIGPISQEWANERFNGLKRDNAAGQDVLAALNMFWLYFADNPKAWHPAISFRYSFYQAAAIMGLNWRFRDWTFKPRPHYVPQMRIYGIEEDKETGRLKVASYFRWRHALAIARQTGRCPPSTFAKRINDPQCEPDDPVDRNDLPPIEAPSWSTRKWKQKGRYKPGAYPDNIEKEMIRVGWKEHTYDAKREKWFRGETGAGKETSVRAGQKESFSWVARNTIERLARR